MKNFALLPFLLVITVLLFPSDAFACACCSEPGTYSTSVRKPGNYERGQLKEIQFAKANLFTTGNGEGGDGITGISPIGESYSLNGLLLNNSWKFNFKDNKGRTGTLVLPMPTTMVEFMVDIHDRKDGDPLLYKELRFKYKVQSGTGIFQKGLAPGTEYFFVLQGRGNDCMNASDFTHWRLEITGKKASYTFVGKLKP